MGVLAIYCHDKETLAATVKAFGSGFKKSNEDTISFVPHATPSVRITSWHDKVCERVVVGTRELPEVRIPETIIPARTEEIVEWRCKPFLGEAAISAESRGGDEYAS
jgi:hypothetical protein